MYPRYVDKWEKNADSEYEASGTDENVKKERSLNIK